MPTAYCHPATRIASWTALLAALLWTTAARAGGFAYPGQGARALSRGGAFVARADDPSAIWYNVAGAGRLRGTQLLVDSTIFNENIRFQRRIYPGPNTAAGAELPVDRYPHEPTQRLREIRNDDTPFPIPFIAVTTDLAGVLRPLGLTLVAGLMGPNAHPSRTYPSRCDPGSRLCEPTDAADGLPNPARYDTLRTRILVLTPTLGLAWRPLPSLSLGATFQASYMRYIVERMVMAFPGTSEDPSQDIHVRIDAADNFTPSGALGAHWQPLRWLSLGASLQLPVMHETRGKVTIRAPQELQETYQVEIAPNPARVSMKITFPMMFRGGVRVAGFDARGREWADLEADMTWEQTSTVQQLDVKTDAGLLLGGLSTPIPVDTLSNRYAWRDTWGARLGGSLRWHDLLPWHSVLILRTGLFYESSAAADANLRLDFMPLSRLGLAAGLGLQLGRWQFSAGYARVLHGRRTVAPSGGDARTGQCTASDGARDCGSQTRVLVPLAPAAGHVMGNGVYDMSIDLFTLGATVALDS